MADDAEVTDDDKMFEQTDMKNGAQHIHAQKRRQTVSQAQNS